jgi:CMP-2-keto-3-deoxyoctulosonic acid synthetase
MGTIVDGDCKSIQAPVKLVTRRRLFVTEFSRVLLPVDRDTDRLRRHFGVGGMDRFGINLREYRKPLDPHRFELQKLGTVSI